MELTYEFELGVPPAEAWATLTDPEKLAATLPGVELKEVRGDELEGSIKVKIGTATITYRGLARYADLDERAHRGVLQLEGHEARGDGAATATVVARLSGDDSTRVQLAVDVSVTGRAEQLGEEALAGASVNFFNQFSQRLESVAGSEAHGPGASTAEVAGVATGSRAAVAYAGGLSDAETLAEVEAEAIEIAEEITEIAEAAAEAVAEAVIEEVATELATELTPELGPELAEAVGEAIAEEIAAEVAEEVAEEVADELVE